MNDDVTAADWGEEYRRLHHRYSDLTTRLKALIEDLLTNEGIQVVQVECRPKAVDSFVEKITRKRAKYGDPLAEITDLVGVRVITYYLDDVVRIGQLIEHEFDVDIENSVDKTQSLDPSEFGYTGVHYVASLSKARVSLPEWSSFSNLRAEIQVRTAAQHAWAAVDHKLNYKSKHEIPDALKRRFYRLSALFELADDQFAVLRSEHHELERAYSESVRKGELDIALDSASLDAYLAKDERVARIALLAEGVGWELRSAEDDPDRAKRDRRDLLTILGRSGIETVKEFDQILGATVTVRASLSAVVEAAAIGNYTKEMFLDDLISVIVILSQGLAVEQFDDLYSDGYVQDVILASANALAGRDGGSTRD